MIGTALQLRAKAAGLSQRRIARLSGFPASTVSVVMSGRRPVSHIRPAIAAILAAWEIMPPELRERWIAATAAAQQEAPTDAG